jgi:hypothetical protein
VVVADISLTQDAKDFLAQADHKRILVLDKFDVTNEEAV